VIDASKINVSMFQVPFLLLVRFYDDAQRNAAAAALRRFLQGKLELDNLQLKPEALDELDLPIKAPVKPPGHSSPSTNPPYRG